MTFRVGIAGVGWGTVVHLPAFRAAAGFEVVGLCARTAAKLERLQEEHAIPSVSTDWEEFVRRDDLDVISVAAPVTLHHPITLAALEAGKHVICEKPLALTTDQCHEMVDAAAKSGLATATCFELRWLPDRSRVRQLVHDNTVGNPYFVRLSQSGSYWHPTRKPQELWMYDIEQGGGYLNGLLAHDIDFVCALFGRPVEVCADVRTSVPTRPLPDGGELQVTADDTSALLLRLDSGALAVISASVVGIHTSGARFEAFGERGSIVGSLGGRQQGELMSGTVDDERLGNVGPDDRVPAHDDFIPDRGASALIRAMAVLLEDWAPQIDGGAPVTPIPTFADGLVVQQVIEAARASASGAGWVQIE
ncbi:MAG: Gfo/Idh/MocA family oxidoreductase [Jiangellaceae bacterium]